MKSIKELEEEFKELHLKCIKETKENGKPSYITHGKRCKALGELEILKEVLKLINEVFEESEKAGKKIGFDKEDIPLRNSVIFLCDSIKLILKQTIEG